MLCCPIHVFVSLVMFLLFQIFSIDFVTSVAITYNVFGGTLNPAQSVALPILVRKSCEHSLSYVNTLQRYMNRVTYFKM